MRACWVGEQQGQRGRNNGAGWGAMSSWAQRQGAVFGEMVGEEQTGGTGSCCSGSGIERVSWEPWRVGSRGTWVRFSPFGKITVAVVE